MAAMTPEQRALVQRIRESVASEPQVREVSMFASRSVLVRDKMIASAAKDGSLLVRVDAGRHHQLLAEAGAQQAEMGAGRDMGPGWITVSPQAIADDEGLAFWIQAAMDYNRLITGKGP